MSEIRTRPEVVNFDVAVASGPAVEYTVVWMEDRNGEYIEISRSSVIDQYSAPSSLRDVIKHISPTRKVRGLHTIEDAKYEVGVFHFDLSAYVDSAVAAFEQMADIVKKIRSTELKK